MAARQDEEYELVLGNKQLLSLFFVVVALFAIFFTFGYSVGFTQGQQDRVVAIANSPQSDPPATDVRIPDALLEEAPKPAVDLTPAPRPAVIASEPVRPQPEPQGTPVSQPKNSDPAPPRAAPAVKTAAPIPVSPGAEPKGDQIARGIHIQVAALRVRSDAQLLVAKLQAKKYPVALYSQGGDGWNRVIVGPFADVNAAKAAQAKLQSDGLKTILRQP
jgi:cell division septation protein DedD